MRIVEPEEGVMLRFQTIYTPSTCRLTWTALFPFSISIHSSGVTLIPVLLHRDLSYHCTIQSDSSISSPSLVTS